MCQLVGRISHTVAGMIPLLRPNKRLDIDLVKLEIYRGVDGKWLGLGLGWVTVNEVAENYLYCI